MGDPMTSATLRFEVLGPLRVRRDGLELDAGPVQQRVMLAVLLLSANRPVSRERLIDAIWGEAAPGRAVNLLQRHAAGLRRVLEPGRRARTPSQLLTWTEAGYLLKVAPGGLDLDTVTAEVARGRSARAAGDLPAAAEALHAALRLWRGRLCEGLAGPLLSAERDRLEEDRLGVVEERVEADLALGADAEPVAELRRLIDAHPLRERPYGLLMRALHRSGRQAEALQVYRDARRLLADELGIEPGAELRRVHEQILTADAALSPPAPARAEAPEPARNDDGHSARLAAGASPPASGNLPAELTSFVDRQRELTEIGELVPATRLVTLTGAGGVGKTRLALRAARNLRPGFSDGVWLVELAGLRDPGLVEHTVATALGIQDRSGRTPLSALIRHLRNRHVLLVLDNCEHLLSTCSPLVDRLLRAVEGLRVVATSRQPLAIDGERIFAVRPLWVPPDAASPCAPAARRAPEEDGAAVTLFTHRARAAVPSGFSLSPENQAIVTRICRRLDGNPLAIELAAGRLRALSPAQLLTRLDDRFRVLATARPTALPRHQTLQATVDWSFHLCTDKERLLWSRLSTFTDTFDLETAEAVCALDDLPAEEVLDLVDGLVDKSVLIREESTDGVRFRLLEMLREYGRKRLSDSGLQAELRRRHRDWYLALAEQGEAEWFGAKQADWAARMRLEHANLREALTFCLTTPGEGRAGVHLAAALYFFWVGCGHVEEAQHWLGRALAVDREPSSERAKALWVLSRIAYLRGDLPGSTARSQECRRLARTLGDEAALAYGTHMAGAAALLGDDPRRAQDLLEDALGRYVALGELNSVVVMAQIQLAMTSVFVGTPDRAVRLCSRARAICEVHDETWTLAYVLYVQAFAEWARGDRGAATCHARESLRLKRDFCDRLGIAMAVDLLGWIAAAEGRSHRAAVLLGAAEEEWNAVGLPWFGSEHWRAPHEEGERLARRALGHEACEDAFRSGARLTPDEVVALALDTTAGPGAAGGGSVAGGGSAGRRGTHRTDRPAAFGLY
ncbi:MULTISPECIES: BTAD domain-containing putative transcriptional regulator [unclassified Streptomyces]|uniref:AfsR/SARP family transcriptional regulator n=1 Tax=unclassified Streptomyces TaxID=2593676 RepID=UPI00278C861D|nr:MULTISPECIES: BTAD domain-containing putative transcriptional regulator [unclassified Streptomyces]